MYNVGQAAKLQETGRRPLTSAAQPTRGTASQLLNCTYGASGWSCKDGSVAQVARLMTFVDADDDVPDARQISVSARHEAVLDDGRRVLLMDDRGWS